MKKNQEALGNYDYEQALKEIRSICRDMTRPEFIKLLDIHELTGLILDRRHTLLSDIRSRDGS